MTDERSGGGDGESIRVTWRDGLIALLLILFVALSGLAVANREGERDASEARASSDAVAVSVFEVIADRDEGKTIEVLFDRPAVSRALVGKVLVSPPVTLSPSIPGSWRWSTDSSLRFQASRRIPVASDLTVALIPERLAGDGRELQGQTEFRVVFDRFLVEDVQAEEGMSPEGDGRVELTGWIRFNYRVDPDLLAPRLRLLDPRRGSSPEILLESTYPQPTLRFRTTPLVKGDEPRELRLVIAGDLISEEGNSPLGADFETALPLGGSGTLAVRRVEPRSGLDQSTLRVTFTSPVEAEIAAQYVRLEPEVDFRLAAERNVLRLVGAFAAGSTYRLSIDSGLPAADRAVLRADVERSVTFPDLPASVTFAADGMFLSRSGYRNLEIDTINVEDLRLVVDRVFPNNLAYLFQHHDYGSAHGYLGGRLWRALGDRKVDESLAVDSERNEKTTTILSLADHFDLERRGLYRVMLGQPDHWEAPQRWILVTDLGLVAKQSADEVVVWALSSRTLRPAAGAEIEVLSSSNQSLGKGRADDDGFWRLRDWDRDAGRPFLVTVRQGEDFGFLHLDRMKVDTSGLDVAGAALAETGYSAFVYGERDLYRPGETLEGVALVRDRDLRPAPPMPVLVRHRTPDGREVATRRLEIDPRGLFELGWEISPVAPTGAHSLELEIAEQRVGVYRFQVEEFVPDRIKVEIEPGQDSARVGEELDGRVVAEYLFGAPASGLLAETRVRLEDSTFSSPAHPEFSFRASDRTFNRREIFSGSQRLDDEGKGSFALEIPSERPPSALTAVITSRVQETGGRGVTGQLRLPVHPFPAYVGVRRIGTGYPEPDEEVTFEAVAVDPEGGEVEGLELTAELLVERWQTVLRRTPRGNYRYESVRDPVVVDSVTLPAPTAGGAPTRFSFTPREYGRHRVVVRDPRGGGAADVAFYVSGWGYSAWAIDNPARLELDLDRDEYGAGDTAVVQVRAPFAGKLWLTVERDRVLSTQVHELDGNTATLEVPIRRSYRPNVYLTATLVRGVEALEPGGVARAYGAVPLNVERGRNRLAVAIDTATELRSEETLAVSVATEPGAAVTVAAVDEGILQLIAQPTADPFAFFYRKLALGVTSTDTFNLLLPEVEAAEAGGGAGAGRTEYVRTEGIRRVKPVAFWSGVVEADRWGEAKAEFELPEFQGALRVMAVAADGARFGSGDTVVRVRDPLIVTPTLPRVLSFGERLEVPVVVRNDTGEAGSFRLALEVSGPATIHGDAAVDLEVPTGRQAIHYFRVDSGEGEGIVAFSFAAEGNDEEARAAVEVPVRADLPPISDIVAGALGERQIGIEPVDKGRFRPQAKRRLTIGSFPLVRFGGRLNNLLRYPYGCLEQTVSRAFPLIYLGDLASEMGVDLAHPRTRQRHHPAYYVEQGVIRVAMHQVAGGGLALWPGADRPNPWAAGYATHFLVEADRAGYVVDSHLLERSLDYLAKGVKAKTSYGEAELERLAYWLYVLARAGRAELGTMDFLRARHADRLRTESKALLAAAYAAVGHRDAVDELLSQVAELERVERQTGRNLRSSQRARAMLLLAHLDAAPGSSRIATLAERLAREADTNRHWTTQEAAFTFLALGQLARQQRERGEYSGEVRVGGRRVGRFTSAETAVFAGLPSDQSIEIRLDRGYSSGAAFYQLETRGTPTDETYQPAREGLQIERRFWDRNRRIVDLDELEQGDLVVIETRVRTLAGRVDNVVVETLLPAGLEIENPRLETTEDLPWIEVKGERPDYLDLRDDRILIFTALGERTWRRFYSLARVVAPGTFRLPPPHAEAMYNPALRASGERGWMIVKKAGED